MLKHEMTCIKIYSNKFVYIFFQGILMLLQNLPTHHWQNNEIGELLAEAFKLKYMFADAPNHLSKKKWHHILS